MGRLSEDFPQTPCLILYVRGPSMSVYRGLPCVFHSCIVFPQCDENVFYLSSIDVHLAFQQRDIKGCQLRAFGFKSKLQHILAV